MMDTTEPLILGVLQGDRRALAQAITLVESERPDHQQRAQALLAALHAHTGRAYRVGISGAPGVGKSSFIECFGLHLVAQGLRVAVLSIDPSSPISGGSILGDKTRMAQLSQHPSAFIRPSPSRGCQGGLAPHTAQALSVLDAAGFDVVIVETVGVGQAEIDVANVTDCFVLLHLPQAGDELQALKKGIVEMADVVVIHKADLDAVATSRAVSQFESVMSLLHPKGHARVPVLAASSRTGEGIDAVWQALVRYRAHRTAQGDWTARRQTQALSQLDARITEALRAQFFAQPAVAAQWPALREAVAQGQLTAQAGAQQLLLLTRQEPQSHA